MGVYIKGMEMPTDNTVLLRIYPKNDGLYYVEQLDIDDDILDKYWAVSVPPHGRLIDADALEQEAQKRLLLCEKYGNQFQKPYDVLRAINEAPTVIPAEEGET